MFLSRKMKDRMLVAAFGLAAAGGVVTALQHRVLGRQAHELEIARERISAEEEAKRHALKRLNDQTNDLVTEQADALACHEKLYEKMQEAQGHEREKAQVAVLATRFWAENIILRQSCGEKEAPAANSLDGLKPLPM